MFCIEQKDKNFIKLSEGKYISKVERRQNPEKWLKYFPEDADVFYFLGEKLKKAKKYKEAKLNYLKAVKKKSIYLLDAEYEIDNINKKIEEIKRKKNKIFIKNFLIIPLLLGLMFSLGFVTGYFVYSNPSNVQINIATSSFLKDESAENVLKFEGLTRGMIVGSSLQTISNLFLEK